MIPDEAEKPSDDAPLSSLRDEDFLEWAQKHKAERPRATCQELRRRIERRPNPAPILAMIRELYPSGFEEELRCAA